MKRILLALLVVTVFVVTVLIPPQARASSRVYNKPNVVSGPIRNTPKVITAPVE